MMNKRVVLGMVLTVALIGTLMLAVAPTMAAEESGVFSALAVGGRGQGRGAGGAGGAGVAFVDADGDGICDNYGTGLYGNGVGFVDADGDGICDNCGTFANRGGAQGRGYRGGGMGRAR